MKLYITAAGVYAGTQVEAKADGKGWRPEEVPTDKQGLIDYLNRLVHKPLGPTEQWGQDDPIEAQPAYKQLVEETNPIFEKLSYTHQSVALDEQWEALPLAQKLHYASLAMEAARDAIPNPPSQTARRNVFEPNELLD